MPAQTTLYQHSTIGCTATRDLSDDALIAAKIARLRDDETFDLIYDVPMISLRPADPPASVDIAGRYRAQLSSTDPAVRALAKEQLKRVGRSKNGPAPEAEAPSGATAVPNVAGSGVDLLTLIGNTVGTLQQRSNGTFVGACPWHSSKSGTCLVIWPNDARWWCSSCRRGGNAATFLSLHEGIDYHTARRKLRMPPSGRNHA